MPLSVAASPKLWGGRVAERVVKARLTVQVSEWEKGWLAAAAAVRTTGTEVERLEQKKQAFEQLGRGLVVTGTALTAVTALSIKAAMGWQSAWAGVTKTVEGTPEQLQAVEDGLRGLTSVLPASHDEIAAVAEAAGQLGIQTDNVVAFTRTMIDMGETTNLSANDAATSLARFMNIMGTAQEDVDNLGSAIVGLGNNYATTEAEIMEMAMRLAGAGKQVGLSEGQVLGLSTALSSVGIEAEAGGSAMSKVMIDIAASVEEGGDRLAMFAKVAGVSAESFAEKWKKDPAAALSLFVKGLSNAEAQGSSTLSVLAELGITEVRMRDALLRSASAADMFAGAMADGNAAFEENNALTLEAAKRYETVESKLAIAGNAVRDAAIDFGDVFLPAVAGAAEAVTEFAGFMGDLPDPVQGVIGVLTSAVGVVALAGGAALLAVPKWVAFKAAVDNLGLSMRTIGLVGGGAVLALTALITVVGSVAAAQAQAQAKAEAYADTLAESTNRVTKATRDMVRENLAAKGSFLWFENPSTLDKAESIGLALDSVTDAAMGNADALRQLRDAQEEYQAAADAARDKGDYNGIEQTRLQNINAVIDAVKGESDSIEEAIRVADQKAKADATSASSSQSVTEAYKSEADAVSDLSAELADLIDTINAANGVGQDAVTANAQYQSALAGLTEQVEKNGASLDQATESGSANAASLADLAGRAQDAASAQFEQDKATMSSKDAADKYYATLQAQRQAFIDSATAAGFNKDEVVKLADQVFKLPSVKEMKVLAETDTAAEKLRLLKQTLDAIPGYKRITLESFSVGKFDVSIPGQATGGPVVGPGTATSDSIPRMLSNGEHVLTAADVDALGGQAKVTELRAGLHSGSDSAWVGTAPQYAMASSSSQPQQLSLDGLSIWGTLEIGGDGLARIINGHITQYDSQAEMPYRGGVRK